MIQETKTLKNFCNDPNLCSPIEEIYIEEIYIEGIYIEEIYIEEIYIKEIYIEEIYIELELSVSSFTKTNNDQSQS